MRIKFDKVNNTLSKIIIVSAIIFNVYIYVISESREVFLATLIFSVFITSSFFIYKINIKQRIIYVKIEKD